MKKLSTIICLFALLAACGRSTFDTMLKNAEEQVGIGDFGEAARIYEQLIAQYPKDSRTAAVLLRLGDLYADSIGDTAKGLSAYQKCIELQPISEAARLSHERRAGIFEEEGRWSGAVEEYTALLKYFQAHSDAPKYRMKLGETYITGREFQQARTELRGFVEKQGVLPELRERALFDIGESYFLEDKPGKAVRFYYALTQEFPKSQLSGEADLRIATCLEEMGYLGQAHKFAEEAKKDYPNADVVQTRLRGIEKRGKSDNQVTNRKATTR